MKIRHEINLLNGTLVQTSTSSPVTANETRYFEASKYSGTLSAYLEVDYTNTVASGTVSFGLNIAAGTDFSLAATNNQATFIVQRFDRNTSTWIAALNAASPCAVKLVINTLPAAGTVTVKAARLIIFEDDGGNPLSKTTDQFEIGNRETGKLNASASALTYPKYWKYDIPQSQDNNYSGVSPIYDSVRLFYAEVTYQAAASMGGCTVILQESSTDLTAPTWSDKVTIISAGTATTPTRVRSAAFIPTKGRMYRIVAYSSSSMYSYDIFDAAIIVEQSTPGNNTSQLYRQGNTAGLAYVEVGNSSSFDWNVNTVFSVSFWIYLASASRADGADIISKQSQREQTPGWCIVYGGGSTGPFVYLHFRGTTGGMFQRRTDIPLKMGAWNHIVLVHPGGGPSTRFYQDGEQTPVYTDFGSSPTDCTNALIPRIGAAGGPQNFIHAPFLLSNMVIYHGTAITAADVQSLFNGTVPGTPTAYWKFNGNSNDEQGTYNGTDVNITYPSKYSGIFRLEEQYLVANTALAAGTNPQNFLTKWDPSDWNGGSTEKFFHQVEASDGNTSQLDLRNGGVQVEYSPVANPDNIGISDSHGIIMPAAADLDVIATTNEGNLYASRIIAQVTKNLPPTSIFTAPAIGEATYAATLSAAATEGQTSAAPSIGRAFSYAALVATGLLTGGSLVGYMTDTAQLKGTGSANAQTIGVGSTYAQGISVAAIRAVASGTAAHYSAGLSGLALATGQGRGSAQSNATASGTGLINSSAVGSSQSRGTLAGSGLATGQGQGSSFTFGSAQAMAIATATAQGSAQTSAPLIGLTSIAARAQGSAIIQGTLAGQGTLGATGSGSGITTALFSTFNPIQFIGQGTSFVQGQAIAVGLASGTSSGSGQGRGTLSATGLLTATGQGGAIFQSTASGAGLLSAIGTGYVYTYATLLAPANGSGLAQGSAFGFATIAASGTAQAIGSGTSSTGATLNASGTMSAQGAGQSSTAAFGATLNPVTAQSSGAGQGSAVLAGTGSLSAKGNGQGSISAFLVGLNLVQGTAAGSSYSFASLSGNGALTGQTAGQAQSVSNLVGTGALSAFGQGESFTYCTGLAGGSLAGTSSAGGYTYAALIATGNLTGQASAQSIFAGSLMGTGSLAGWAFGSTSTSAQLRAASDFGVFDIASSIGIAQLAGTANASAADQGGSSAHAFLSASSTASAHGSGSGFASAQLSGLGLVSAIGTAGATTSADLGFLAQGTIQASTFGQSFTFATLIASGRLQSAPLTGTAIAIGRIDALAIMSATASGGSTANATLTEGQQTIQVTSQAQGSSSSFAELTGLAAIRANATGQTWSASTLAGLGLVSGNATGQTQTGAALEASGLMTARAISITTGDVTLEGLGYLEANGQGYAITRMTTRVVAVELIQGTSRLFTQIAGDSNVALAIEGTSRITTQLIGNSLLNILIDGNSNIPGT